MSDLERLIVVVDDDPSVRRGLDRLLRAAGYRVEAFGSAQELLDGAVLGAAGCLILDVRLPGLNGLDLQETLAAGGNTVPIIFITGHGDAAMNLRALKAGAIGFLQKPFAESALLEAVRDAFTRPRGAE